MSRNERTNQTIGIIALCAALLAATGAEALTVTRVSQVTRPSSSTYGAEQISGITWAGGNLYYAVDDADKKLYPLTLDIGADGSLAPSNITIGAGVTMSGADDMEGCAFDPASGKVWVSMEKYNANTSASVWEYDPETGTCLRTAPVPALQQQCYDNYSLEALTLSGDGLTMWTCNEESLKCDGTNSTLTAGTTVRLTKFTRSRLGADWVCNGEWAYLTEPIAENSSQYLASSARCGVSALTALPDGTLLVLERGYRGWGSLADDFKNYIYAVDFSGATEISGIASLKNATDVVRVKKTKLWSDMELKAVNYEGMCLGPRLSDGSVVLVVVADGGSGGNEKIMTLKLTDISNIWTVNYAGPTGCEPYGGPYRYMNDASVTATYPGAGSPYETDLVVHPRWALSSGSAFGDGGTAEFTVSGDETFYWVSYTNSVLPMVAADSFERIALETEARDIAGWSGDAWVAAHTNYPHKTPPGYPLSRETHDQVLEVDGNVTRTYDTSIVGGVILDTMIRATLPTPDTPVADNTDCFIAFHFDEQGHPMLQHGDRNGNAIRARARSGVGGNDPVRTVLSDNIYTNGQWLRLTIKVDGRPSGTWCHVSIDGFACVTSGGAYQPGSNPQMDGAWYRALSTNEVISAIELKGTGAVDDVTLFTATANDPNSEFPEFKVTDENGDRLPDADFYEWLNENGLPLDPNADVDGDTFSSLKEYLKDTDPWDKSNHPVFPTVFFGM